MKPRELKVKTIHGELDLKIHTETVLHSMRRAVYRQEFADSEENDSAMFLLKNVTYPDLMAVSEGMVTFDDEVHALPMDFDTFLTTPGPLAMAWENAVYEMNPHFMPDASSEEEKKKEPQSSTGS